ncbi:MAG: DUF6252 family protein [Bacteroidota bacterium]
MKKLLIICAIALSFGASCKKKTIDPKADLPTATQTGANTFGAMANGTILLPRHDPLRPGGTDFVAYYSTVVTPATVNFNITANDTAGDPFRKIQLTSTSTLQEGQSYSLQVSSTNPVSAAYIVNTINTYTVTPPLTGQLTITKLDQTNHIISGTFYFDAVNSAGDKISVTDGRFDAKY